MKKSSTLAFPKDGPRTVLRKMEEIGISSIFVVNKDYQVQGVVMADAAAELASRGGKDLDEIIIRDIPKVAPDTPINELYPLFEGISFPLAVVNDEDRLQGVIVRGSILAGLARRRDEE